MPNYSAGRNPVSSNNQPPHHILILGGILTQPHTGELEKAVAEFPFAIRKGLTGPTGSIPGQEGRPAESHYLGEAARRHQGIHGVASATYLVLVAHANDEKRVQDRMRRWEQIDYALSVNTYELMDPDRVARGCAPTQASTNGFSLQHVLTPFSHKNTTITYAGIDDTALLMMRNVLRLAHPDLMEPVEEMKRTQWDVRDPKVIGPNGATPVEFYASATRNAMPFLQLDGSRLIVDRPLAPERPEITYIERAA